MQTACQKNVLSIQNSFELELSMVVTVKLLLL